MFPAALLLPSFPFLMGGRSLRFGGVGSRGREEVCKVGSCNEFEQGSGKKGKSVQVKNGDGYMCQRTCCSRHH
jgi:hypothetical protein